MRFIVFILLLFPPLAAYAYVGPGMGLGVIGAILGALLVVVMAIAGVVWYPVKRLLKRNRAAAAGNTGDANTRSKEAGDGAEKNNE